MRQAYNFELINTDNNEYTFVTSNQLIYNIAFVKVDFYFPENFTFNQSVFELIIQLDESQKNVRAIRDPNFPQPLPPFFLIFFILMNVW